MALTTRRSRTLRANQLGAQIPGGNRPGYAVPGGSNYAYNPQAWEAAFRNYGINQQHPGAIVNGGLNWTIPGGNTPNAAVRPVAKPASPPAAPAAPGVTPSATAAPVPPSDPKDATYAAAIAQAAYDRDSQLAQLRQTETYDRVDLAEAIRRMTEQRPQDEQRTREAANRAGLLFSGKLGEDLGKVGTDYVRRQGDMQLSFDRRQADREGARRGAEAGYGLTDGRLLAEAIGRQIGRDSDAAAAGALVPETADAAAQPGTTAPGAPTGIQALAARLPAGALRGGGLNWTIPGGNTKTAAVRPPRKKPKAGRF